jgi:hypothetical protein
LLLAATLHRLEPANLGANSRDLPGELVVEISLNSRDVRV